MFETLIIATAGFGLLLAGAILLVLAIRNVRRRSKRPAVIVCAVLSVAFSAASLAILLNP